jgi:hypothetical protein
VTKRGNITLLGIVQLTVQVLHLALFEESDESLREPISQRDFQ